MLATAVLAVLAVLPLGPPGLPESRSTETLAPGLTHTRIVRGFPDTHAVWTVDVMVTRDRTAAAALRAELAGAGFDARVKALRADRFLVRSGAFATQAEATPRAAALGAAGHPGGTVVNTVEDGDRTTGPWVVNVLDVDLARFAGGVAPRLATGIVPGREPLSALEQRTGALAGVNGGYFVLSAADGTEGDLAGSAIERGRLISEAVDGRTDLILRGRRATVSALADAQRLLASDGATRDLDGDNRAPGLIRSCGGSGGDQPTERPLHDFTCTDASEVIRFTRVFGATTPSGDGAEAVLDRHGRVRALRSTRGGPIPVGGSVLAGTGEGADWLRAHARLGARVVVRTRVRSEAGPLALRRGLGVVNGGPRLLRAGRTDITYAAEGFDHPDDPAFLYQFGIRRNPRTLAGVTRDGHLLLVTVDGHAPGYSVGASFWESAALMRALGARDAVNLDGGGSTTMAIRGVVVNRPSDATGERPIGDALLIGTGR
jgi:hypothetical protein